MNPVHTYNKSGLYSVTLTASNASGSNALTKTGYIAVSYVLTAPVANFSASSTSGKVPFKVSFTDQSTGSPTSCKKLRKWGTHFDMEMKDLMGGPETILSQKSAEAPLTPTCLVPAAVMNACWLENGMF